MTTNINTKAISAQDGEKWPILIGRNDYEENFELHYDPYLITL